MTIGLTGLMKSLLKKEKSIHKLQRTAAIKYQLRPFANKRDVSKQKAMRNKVSLFFLCDLLMLLLLGFGEKHIYDFWHDASWMADSGGTIMSTLSAEDIKPKLNQSDDWSIHDFPDFPGVPRK